MPANEKPPARPVDIYLWKTGENVEKQGMVL